MAKEKIYRHDIRFQNVVPTKFAKMDIRKTVNKNTGVMIVKDILLKIQIKFT